MNRPRTLESSDAMYSSTSTPSPSASAAKNADTCSSVSWIPRASAAARSSASVTRPSPSASSALKAFVEGNGPSQRIAPHAATAIGRASEGVSWGRDTALDRPQSRHVTHSVNQCDIVRSKHGHATDNRRTTTGDVGWGRFQNERVPMTYRWWPGPAVQRIF